MQNDLISRSKLLEDLEAAAGTAPEGQVQTAMLIRDRLAFATGVVEQAEAVDAVPVVHGRWVWFENRPVTDADDPECIGCTGYECSECGNNEGTCIRFYEELSPDMLARIKEGLMEFLTNYCPNCGAKMDGDPDV